MSTELPFANVAIAAKAAIEARGISVRKFSRRLGMKPDTVNDFLNQKRETRDSTRISICRDLGLNPDTGQPIIPSPVLSTPSEEAKSA